MKKAGQVCGSVFFLYALIVVPLFFKNKYFDMLQAKGNILILGLIITLCFMAGVLTAGLIKRSLPEFKLKLVDIGLIVLAAAGICGAIISGSFSESLWGMNGWGVGLFAIFGLCAAIIFLPRIFEYRHNLLIPVLLVNCFIGIIAILHAAGVDALNLHQSIKSTQFFSYISTLGNANWVSGYEVMTLSLFALLFINGSGRFNLTNALYILAIVPGVMTALSCGSDSLLLGAFAVVLVSVPFILANASRLSRFGIFILIVGVCLASYRFIPAFSRKMTTYGGVFERLFDIPVIAAVLVLGVAISFFGKFWDNTSLKVRRVTSLVIVMLMAAAAVSYIVYTVFNFSDGWGTDRGFIWKCCLKEYAKLPLIQKLFGVGPELMYNYMQEAAEYFQMSLTSAHSEPVGTLLGSGIIGLAGWLLAWAGVIISYFKNKVWNREYLVFFAPLAGYFAQSLVNSPMAANAAVLAAIFVCYRAFAHKEGQTSEKF